MLWSRSVIEPPVPPADPRPLAVLVVEDDRLLGRMLTRLLSAEGYEVAHAMTGREALRRWTEKPADVVLLDLMLPDIDGLEVCRALRRRGQREASIIVVSARCEASDQEKAFEAGAGCFLAKPFQTEELLRLVRARCRVPKAAPDRIGRTGG